MVNRNFVLLTVLAVGFGSACRAESESPFAQPEEQPVAATLIAEHASIQPGGATRIGVLFEIQEGWHIYAQDPGDAGLPTQVTWSAPQGFSFGPLQWPEPRDFVDPGDIRTSGYEDQALLVSELAMRGAAEIIYGAGDMPIRAEVGWLACHEICIPGKASLELSLPVSAEPSVLSPHAPLFASTQ